MLKLTYRLILVLAALMMLLAACGPADTGGTGTTPGAADGAPTAGVAAPADTPAVPGTGPDSAAQCAGVDTEQLTTGGQQLYENRCASCHGAQGEGVGDFPAIAGNATVTGEDAAQLVEAYFAVEAHPRDVTPEEIASLFTYVRGAFGNTAAVVCPEEITIPATQ